MAHHLPPDAARVGVIRPIATDPGGPSDLALPAAQQALDRAGLAVADVDLIVFATMTPDVTFPGSACYLQDKLGCGTIGAGITPQRTSAREKRAEAVASATSQQATMPTPPP